MTTYAQVRAFRNGDHLYDRDYMYAPSHALRAIVRTFESHGFRFTGVARWFMDSQPCRVLSFVQDDNTTVNYYLRFR